MTMYLQGGRTGPENTADNAWIAAARAHGGTEIIYVPFALDADSYDRCFRWFTNTYGDRLGGFTLALANLDTRFDPARVASVHIAGGRTDRLLGFMQNFGFAEQLAEYHAAGGVVYGSSAGAIVLGHDIRTAREVPDDFPQSTGLEYLDGHAVVPHYLQAGHLALDAVQRWSQEFPVLAIPSESGASFDGTSFTSYGDRPCQIWVDGVSTPVPGHEPNAV